MAFKCNKCNLTWPDKKNTLEDPNEYNKEGICPECEEDDEDDDPSYQTRFHP